MEICCECSREMNLLAVLNKTRKTSTMLENFKLQLKIKRGNGDIFSCSYISDQSSRSISIKNKYIDTRIEVNSQKGHETTNTSN